jgi:predicted glycoside hydrolase/deacetylase ChbG (UPF0249 family)
MTDDAVKTADNSKRTVGKPFTKGDKRINRAGRPRVPKSAVELNKLIDEIAAEDVVNPSTGEQVQRIKAMLRSLMTGRDSRGKVHILDRRYGKVKEEIENSGEIKIVVKYDDANDNPNAT